MPDTSPAGVSRSFSAALLAWCGRLLLVVYFLAGTLILVGRAWLMPEIGTQRDWIADRLSEAVGLKVSIGNLGAGWPGLHPELVIDDLQIHDHAGQPALALGHVEVQVGWSSLWQGKLVLHRLDIAAPTLELRRDATGVIHIAGLPMSGEGESGFTGWLLDQGRIVVRDARIVWQDELRAAPVLELAPVQVELRNFGRHHSFGLIAQPVGPAARQLDVRGNLEGGDPAQLADWRGELYADLDNADIAVWRQWLDLPFEWSSGRGGVRVWLSFANRQPTMVTADLQVADVSARLRSDLPPLDLEHLKGRIVARKLADGQVAELRGLSLATMDGATVSGLDARLELHTSGKREGGKFTTNHLDLAVLAAIAHRLPLPANLHDPLQAFAPRGQLDGLELSWRGPIEALADWQAKGRFLQLGLSPYQELPGFSGLNGSFSGDAHSGEVRLASQNARIALPRVFADPVVELAQLDVDAGWRARDGATEFILSRADFRNESATGDATGTYRYTGSGLGVIDLSAHLKQAAGNAVWRYMPLVVNIDARNWLHAGIVGGMSDETTLRLKGPLDAFPFADGKQGIFQVKGSIRGATLNYAPNWPQITGIDGDLLFEGVRMQIRARKADIMGVTLSDVIAVIPSLDAYEEQLVVTGKARGETQRFLAFIEASPVGEMIDHFTEPMQAQGNGTLDLRLDLPLRKLATTKVDGKFRFSDNQLKVLPALPPLTMAQGEFRFSGDKLEGRGLRARFLDAPVTLSVGSGAGGAVRIEAKGTLSARGARQEYGWPIFDHLSGETSWTSTIRIRKPGAEIRIESSLDGLSSSLPAPFNKTTRDVWPLRINGRIDRGAEDWQAALGNLGSLQMVWSDAADSLRGRIALGEAPRIGALPNRGLTVAVAHPSIDLDGWRTLSLLASNGNGGTASAGLIGAIELKTPLLKVFDRSFHDVRLAAQRPGTEDRWRVNLDGRELRGQVTWDNAGAGRLSGHMNQLFLPASELPAPALPDAAELARTPPDLDLIIDDFHLRDMALGEVRIQGTGRDKLWQGKLAVKNDAANLTGDLRWHAGPLPETALAFRLDIDSGEKLLTRLGTADALRGGRGRIEGDFTWPGPFSAFSAPALSGRIRTEIGKGQFKKLEPGVGRLLGVLSLQSLPRRITLDFRDVFSEGFAFDSISGDGRLERGRLQTDELRIRGPAAKVVLAGQIDVVAETQNLKVRVQPAIGETVAVGAMIANPVVGAVAWLAQKALNDPLDQVFAYEYAVTGPWSDPQVQKLNRSDAKSSSTAAP